MFSACPLCGSMAKATYVPHLPSLDFDCRQCTKFRISYRALSFIEENNELGGNRLPLLARAAQAAEGQLVINDEQHIAAIAAEQEAKEARAARKEE